MTETERRTLARSLPDVPKWLEVRSMLLSDRCEVLGLEETGAGPSFVARELEVSEDRSVCIVGRPSAEDIGEATKRNRNGGIVMAAPEDASHVLGVLPDWTATRATLHLPGDAPPAPASRGGRGEAVRSIGPARLG